MKAFVLLVILIVAGFLVYSVNGGGGRVNREVAAACDDGRIDARKMLAFWRDKGVIQDISDWSSDRYSSTVLVNDKLWEGIGHKARVSIAIAAYCRIKSADGKGYALIKLDYADKDFAYVMNGDYFRD